jgi:hypothetical protein
MFKKKKIKRKKAKCANNLYSIICFFPYALSPTKSAPNRMLGMAESLVKLNHDMYLISYKYNKSSYNINNSFSSFKSVKTIKPLGAATFFLNLIINIFKRIKKARRLDISSNNLALSSRKLLFLKKFYILLLMNGYYTPGAGYIPLFKVKNIMKNLINSVDSKYKILITSHGPTISHEIGVFLKKKYKDNLFWVADYRDLIEQNYYSIIKTTGKLRKINNQTFKNADLIVTVSKGLKNALINQASTRGLQISNKTIVIYNGFSEVEFNSYKIFNEKIYNNKLIIVYTGTLYPNKRDPSTLLKAISFLNKERKKQLKVLYAGQNENFFMRRAKDCGIEESVESLGLIPRHQALELQKKASILLLIKGGGKEDGIITGKFFEYLKWKKPILVIGDKDVEFNNIANKIGGIKIFGYGEIENISFIINKCIINKNNLKQVFGNMNKDEIKKFEWDNLTEKLIKEINLRIKTKMI